MREERERISLISNSFPYYYDFCATSNFSARDQHHREQRRSRRRTLLLYYIFFDSAKKQAGLVAQPFKNDGHCSFQQDKRCYLLRKTTGSLKKYRALKKSHIIFHHQIKIGKRDQKIKLQTFENIRILIQKQNRIFIRTVLHFWFLVKFLSQN